MTKNREKKKKNKSTKIIHQTKDKQITKSRKTKASNSKKNDVEIEKKSKKNRNRNLDSTSTVSQTKSNGFKKGKSCTISTSPNKKRKLKKSSSSSKIEKYLLVPWESKDKWDRVSIHFNQNEFTQVLQEICIWKERVTSLPVGVESTLVLIQAILYDHDQSTSSSASDDQSRSLYSLAVIRFLNHVSQLASKELGGSTLPMFNLAAMLNVPDWIVNLRHEVSHGTSLPTMETLRLAAEFIKNWLKENYWILPNTSITNPNILTTEKNPKNEDLGTIYNQISEILSAYIASRVYSARHSTIITDFEITKFITGRPKKIKTKEATLELKRKIINLLATNPHLTITTIANEMIPEPNFYSEFSSLFGGSNNNFEQFALLWTPLLNSIVKKKKLTLLITQLAQIHVGPEGQGQGLNTSSHIQNLSSQWINKLLDMVDQGNFGKRKITSRVLPILVKNPTTYTGVFLKRLMDIAEVTSGTTVRRKLETLVSIWQSNSFDAIGTGSTVPSSGTFTLEQVMSLKSNMQYNSVAGISFGNWSFDSRDGQMFWKNIPLGYDFISTTENGKDEDEGIEMVE